MRLSQFARFTVLAFVMITPVQVLAQGMIVSKFNCVGALPCDGADPSFPSSEEVATLGNKCVSQNTGGAYREIFDTIAGIDDNGCLTPVSSNSSTPPNSGGPRCCVKARGENSCYIHCDIVVQ